MRLVGAKFVHLNYFSWNAKTGELKTYSGPAKDFEAGSRVVTDDLKDDLCIDEAELWNLRAICPDCGQRRPGSEPPSKEVQRKHGYIPGFAAHLEASKHTTRPSGAWNEIPKEHA